MQYIAILARYGASQSDGHVFMQEGAVSSQITFTQGSSSPVPWQYGRELCELWVMVLAVRFYFGQKIPWVSK